MKTVHKEAQVALSKLHNDMTHYADFHRGEAPEYKIGDKVCDVINVSRIRPYRPLATGQSTIPPEPIVIEGTPKYKVEEITDS